MPPKQRSDYTQLLEHSQALIRAGKATNFVQLARLLNISRATLASAFERNFGITAFEQIVKVQPQPKNTPLISTENAEEAEVTIDGNDGVIRSVIVEGQIKTVDQLLALTGTAADFYVHDPRVKKWDVAIKVKDGEHQETIKVIPSIYIEAPLRRKNPIAFEPVISPIEIQLPKLPKTLKPKTNGVNRALIINDPQIGFRRTLHTTDLIPFHDRRVLDLALQLAQELDIQHISLGGDVNDLSEWSIKFTPEPEFYWTTQPAIIETAWWLSQLRMAQPHAEINMLEGNHDLRMPNLILQNLKQAYKLKAVDEMELPPQLSVPRLLALHRLGVNYLSGYPSNGYWLNDNIRIEHGDVVRAGPGDTAKAIVNKQAYTTIFGHIHRRESVTRRLMTHSGDIIHTAFCPGCACHIDGRVPGSSPKDQWQQGIAIIEYTQTSENIIPIAIRDGRMIYNGKQYTARPRDKEINTMLTKTLATK